MQPFSQNSGIIDCIIMLTLHKQNSSIYYIIDRLLGVVYQIL
nr:MAG TPA: hypothetical protein [Caudoviricetes sp.]